MVLIGKLGMVLGYQPKHLPKLQNLTGPSSSVSRNLVKRQQMTKRNFRPTASLEFLIHSNMLAVKFPTRGKLVKDRALLGPGGPRGVMVGLRGVIGHFSAPLTGTIPGRDNVINTYRGSAATVSCP